jgi:hypothetical protein
MKLIYFTLLFILTNSFYITAQEISTNIGLDTLSLERNKIIKLWSNYLKSNPDEINNNPYWSENDKLKYKSYDLLKSEGFLSPSLYYFQLNNKILSISKLESDYVIKSAFYDKEAFEIYAITNVVATKINDEFYLTNYQPKLTKEWKTKTVGNITYNYFPEYNFDETKAKEANNYLMEICSAFELKPQKINYFICRDCEDVFRIKGFDYVLSMGNAKECGFFDNFNNIIYATAIAGENHQHEITHFINNYFPNANELLLTGLSAYWGEENAHKGKPLKYSVKIVNEYLKSHPEIDLNKPNDFWKIDEETNPQYVIGAIICDIAFEKGGINMLKQFLSKSKNEEEFLSFIEKELKVKKGDLNKIIRQKIEKISTENKFDNAKLKASH